MTENGAIKNQNPVPETSMEKSKITTRHDKENIW